MTRTGIRKEGRPIDVASVELAVSTVVIFEGIFVDDEEGKGEREMLGGTGSFPLLLGRPVNAESGGIFGPPGTSGIFRKSAFERMRSLTSSKTET